MLTVNSQGRNPNRSSYFMSEQEEAASKWKTIEEFERAKSHLANLQKEAKRLGEAFSALGTALVQWPDTISVSEGEVSFSSHLGGTERAKFSVAVFDPCEVGLLANDLRKTKAEKDTAFQAAKDMGANLEY